MKAYLSDNKLSLVENFQKLNINPIFSVALNNILKTWLPDTYLKTNINLDAKLMELEVDEIKIKVMEEKPGYSFFIRKKKRKSINRFAKIVHNQ